jgi:predicted GNAT superfamily acetyltransferase
MTDNIGFLISDVSRLMRRRFDDRARQIGVTRAQWRTLTMVNRNEGINQGKLAELLEVASARGFHTVMARIVGHHEASIALHRAAGFEPVGIEREVGRKFGQWLDVMIMQRML